MPNFKEHSKTKWSAQDPDTYPGDTEMKIGCLQRIADATELMATNFIQLQNDRDWYKRMYHEKRDEKDKLKRRISALQGVITKMKKR